MGVEIKYFLFILLVVFGSTKAHAQESLPEYIGKDLASPFITDARYVLLAGSVITGGIFFYANKFSTTTTQEVNDKEPLSDYSKYGDYAGRVSPNAAYVVGMLLHGIVSGNPRSYKRSLLMFKSTSYAGIVCLGMKYSIQEQRPNGSSVHNSFPSGHTTTAFAFASAIAADHEWYFGLPAYLLAIGVGVSRMQDNAHYLHDVVAGATLGMSYGLGIYYRMRKGTGGLAQANTETSFDFSLLPDEAVKGLRLTLQARF